MKIVMIHESKNSEFVNSLSFAIRRVHSTTIVLYKYDYFVRSKDVDKSKMFLTANTAFGLTTLAKPHEIRHFKEKYNLN